MKITNKEVMHQTWSSMKTIKPIDFAATVGTVQKPEVAKIRKLCRDAVKTEDFEVIETVVRLLKKVRRGGRRKGRGAYEATTKASNTTSTSITASHDFRSSLVLQTSSMSMVVGLITNAMNYNTKGTTGLSKKQREKAAINKTKAILAIVTHEMNERWGEKEEEDDGFIDKANPLIRKAIAINTNIAGGATKFRKVRLE